MKSAGVRSIRTRARWAAVAVAALPAMLYFGADTAGAAKAKLCNGLTPTIMGTDAGETIEGTPGVGFSTALLCEQIRY